MCETNLKVPICFCPILLTNYETMIQWQNKFLALVQEILLLEQ